MKTMKRCIAGTAALTVAACLITGCAKDEARTPAEHKEDGRADVVTLPLQSREDIGLRTEIARLKPFTGMMTIPASVFADQDKEAQVGALVPGRVHRVLVKTGEHVKAGQVLMLVEGLEIGVIKAAFLSAKATLEFKKANFERQQALAKEQIGSARSLTEAQAEYEKALAEFNAEDKKIHSIGLNDADVIRFANGAGEEHTSGTLPVKSPIAGVVAERNVVIGQLVDGTTNAFRIINTSTVWVDGQIYEKDLQAVAEGSVAEFIVGSYPDEKFHGRVTLIGQMIDERSRTITVRAEFNNPSGKMKPHMYGELRVPVGKAARALMLPVDAIVKIDQGAYVFVARTDSTFERRAVTTGAAQNGLIEIREGIKENEAVVVKGAFSLKSELMKEELEEEEH